MNSFRHGFLACLALTTGCAQLVQSIAKAGEPGLGDIPPAEGGIYVGAECGIYQTGDTRDHGVFQSHDDQRRPILRGNRGSRRAMTPAEGAVFLTCVHQTGDTGLGSAETYDAIIADHLDFNDRNFDHIRAAAMVMDCAMNLDCGMPSGNSRDILGMMATYEHRLDAGAADRALADAGASQALRQAFAAKLTWARGTLQARVEALDLRRRDLWVGVPEQVWTERAEYFGRYSKLYAELDPLVVLADTGTGDQEEAARKLRALRGRYLDACKVEGCLFTPFVLETTRALSLIAVRQKDVPTALAEAELLADSRLQAQFFSRAMLAALMPAAKREAETYEKFSRAQRDGADDAALRAMFGDKPPIHISADGPWIVWGQKQLPNLTSALSRDGLVSGGGNVRTVQRRGDRAVVVFADSITRYGDADCRETNRIDGISSSGTIIYRQICTNHRTITERTKVAPIDIPAEEAAGLRPGDLVNAWVTADGRRGALIDAQREGLLVQVRGHRLRVKEPRGES